MDLALFAATVCSGFLGLFNGFLTGIGIAITVKGGIYLIFAFTASTDYWEKASQEAGFYRVLSLLYILPGVLMIIFGSVGISSVKGKLRTAVPYCIWLAMHIGVKIYYSTKSGIFTLYAIILILSSFDGVETRVDDYIYSANKAIVPEYLIESALLLATLYIIYYNYKLQEKLKKLIELRNRLAEEIRQNESHARTVLSVLAEPRQ